MSSASLTSLSPTVARVRPAAIEANVGRLVARAGTAALCAVVKADGYGHGASTAARAAVDAGASWLAVATIEEALEVADSVGSDTPVLILSEIAPPLAADAAAGCPEQVRFTVASTAGIEALAGAAGPARTVHLKVDTGMHRMGALPGELAAVAEALAAAGSRLQLEGTWTHLAVADSPSDPFTDEQLRRFDLALAALRGGGLRAGIVHAANSAGLLAHPEAPSRPRAGQASPPTASRRRRSLRTASSLSPRWNWCRASPRCEQCRPVRASRTAAVGGPRSPPG